MKITLKKRWVKALRSGEFKQAEGDLHNECGYCCLGVLRYCLNVQDRSSLDEENSYLTEAQAEKAGLTFKQQNTLANMNDKGKTFEQIAKHIERRL